MSTATDRNDGRDASLEAVISELRRQLLRYRADRHPVEHATAQFHLGATFLQAERIANAIQALATSAELFGANERPVEQAKARNMLGAALRASGDLGAARAAFADAAGTFGAHDLPGEEGAARHNLGLVHRDRGDERAAAEAFAAALGLFDVARAPAQTAAAARELGTSLFHLGDLDDAIAALDRAERAAAEAGELAGLGAAANVRGLALLAADRAGDAVAAFEAASGAHPRRVRPDGYAMARANLALAAERSGRPHLARLAARQALASPVSPPPVVDQAREVLERLGEGRDDLHMLLDEEPAERWPHHLRDEVLRWADASDVERAAALGAWIDGELARADSAEQRAATWLDVLIEQPPRILERVGTATMRALADRDPEVREEFRSVVRRASARLGVPQLMRLEDTFDRLASDVGLTWR